MWLYLCSLLAFHMVTATAVSSGVGTCSSGGQKKVDVDGWPVLAALRVPLLAKTAMNLSLSHGHDEHTQLSLTHSSLEGKVGVMQAELTSRVAYTTLSTAALLSDSAWASLTIVARHDLKLELNIESETRLNTYSTNASLNISQHLHVSKVTCSGQGCDSYIDLHCRYGEINHNKKHKPTRNKSTTRESDHGMYYWILYVLITLLVTACLLYLVWRHERKKFRKRWLTHSQAIRNITFDQDGNSTRDTERSDVVVWRPETNEGHSNLGYDAAGDTDTSANC